MSYKLTYDSGYRSTSVAVRAWIGCTEGCSGAMSGTTYNGGFHHIGVSHRNSDWIDATPKSTVDDRERQMMDRLFFGFNVGASPKTRYAWGTKVRCDRIHYVGGSGCVMKNYVPTLQLSRGDWPASTAHIAASQSSGYPGGSKANPLTRKKWFTTNKNRQRAKLLCGDDRPEDYDCDEYPFSTTHQGCYTSGSCSVW